MSRLYNKYPEVNPNTIVYGWERRLRYDRRELVPVADATTIDGRVLSLSREKKDAAQLLRSISGRDSGDGVSGGAAVS